MPEQAEQAEQAERNERDEFTERLTELIIGVCVRADGLAWCSAHNARWPRRMTACTHRRDMEGFADQMLEEWEGRNR